MSSVDERIVSMKFDNSQFDGNAQKSMSILDRLKSALNFGGAGKGLEQVQNSANSFSLKGLEGGITGVSGKFLAMTTVAVTALATIVSKAVTAGAQVANAFTLQPLKDGFAEYETKIGSIQTILSNTARYGTQLGEVNSVLNDLNNYADKTIYSFGDMTKNIGLFTNAGIKVGDAAQMIKGFSNEAAASGTNAQGAASAAYQLSQALSAGTIRLMDWRSLQNVGMGNKNMQHGIIEIADAMGTLDKAGTSSTEVSKNFNGSLEKGWLSADVMSSYLKIMAGDMSDAQMKAMGLSDTVIAGFKKQQQMSEDAATKVRTFTQLVGTIKESVGSGWGQTFETLIGNFDQATALWTGVNNTLGGMINKWSNARNKLLTGWAKMGGRSDIINGLKNVFNGVMAILKPIKDAFREIFPPQTAKSLKAITQSFEDFTKGLKIGKATANDLKRTFAGVFAIFDIGWQAIKALLNVIGSLFSSMSDGAGSFLEITGNIGDWLVKLDEAIKKGDVFNNFFDKLGKVLAVPLAALKVLGGAIVAFFSNLTNNPLEAVGQYFGRLKDRISPLSGALDVVKKAWGGLIDIMGKVGNVVAPIFNVITAAFGKLFNGIADALRTGDFSGVTDALNTGLFAVIALSIKHFLDKGLNINLDGGLINSIKETFGGLTDVLSAMQNQINSKTLMNIAIAVAILTASIVALSLIDSGKLTKAMTGVAVGFGILLAAMTVMSHITTLPGAIKMPLLAASMVTLSVAILILAGAVKALSGMSWEELAKGLLGVMALLAMIAGLSKTMGNTKGIAAAGLAMIPMAIGLKILASVVKDFSKMSWADLGKGMAALAGGLLIIAGAMQLMPKDMLAKAAALVILGGALKIIGSALADMAKMSWGDFAKSMAVLAGSLILLAAGMIAMEGSLPGAAALIVAAAALMIMTPALQAFGNMSWESIAKAMVVLFGSLLLLAAGMLAMEAGLPGAAALIVAAAALAILTPVLTTLGAMSWEAILKGLTALAGVFLVLGVAGLLLTPVIPMIMLLAGALLILGAGVALIGGGLLAIAAAFTIFVAAGTAGLSVLSAMIGLIPLLATNIALGIGTFVTTLASQATAITAALVTLVSAALDGLITLIPKAVTVFSMLIDAGISIIVGKGGQIAAAAVGLVITMANAMANRAALFGAIAGRLITNLINGISLRIGSIVNAAVNLITKFMDAIGNAAPRLAKSGVDMVLKLVNGIANGIRSREGDMKAAGRNIGSAIVSGLTAGISGAASGAISAAVGVAKGALAAAKRALGIHSPSREFYAVGNFSILGMKNAFEDGESTVAKAASGSATAALSAVRKSMEGASNSLALGLNTDPVIKPVLDLSDISKDASKINGMLDPKTISPETSYKQAAGISNSQLDLAQQLAVATTPQPTEQIHIEMPLNISSPKALSSIEIYRNTQSQMAMLKEAIKK